jgi:hypothetical protein
MKKMAAESYKFLNEDYSESVMSKGSVLEWNKRFHKKGDVHDNS